MGVAYVDYVTLFSFARHIAYQMATPGNDLSSRVELRLSCSNLRDADFLSKSDPLVVIYVQSGDHWTEVGETV